ncbi:porin family protein [Aquibium carbonis]|uniref:Porin family protein n=1 Tax=Aquibium carbonis TaxID=2495581 RepID=A0A3R9ZUW7_9HYPH|nr:outer membrane beta-barrel protein [Aquibium carbonis]RST88292.1 porin family protein [Aquibium carbonis]
MKQFLIATAAVVAMVSAAQAQQRTFDWSGPYVGAEIGGGFSSTNFAASSTDFAGGYREDVMVGGVFAGYDWQFGPVVYGLAADIDFVHSADLAFGDEDALTGGKGEAYTYDVDWVSTARARLGYTPTDRILVYGTGGIAAGHFEATSYSRPSFFDTADTASYSGVKWGGVFGAGVDFALPNDWSLKAEYLNYRFESINFGGEGLPNTSFKPKFEAVKFGLAYRF